MKFSKIIFVITLSLASVSIFAQRVETTPVYLDESAPLHDRIMDLIGRMTPMEKMSMMIHNAPAIPRLGIDKYYHGNEALHGVMRPGKFTVFPQAIGMAASWNPTLMQRVANAISDEARGRWNELELGKKQKENATDLLTFWSPTINMARDPRWGRTGETYGEDPFLTGMMGCAFVRGLQGNDPRYVKVVSTVKHFAANNEEHNRTSCNAIILQRDLREYYFPAFERCVKDAHVQSVMTAYNAINNVPCVANPFLTQKVLRQDWGFDGFVVSDCMAPELLTTSHHLTKDFETGAVLMVKAGLDLECSDHGVYQQPLYDAYNHYRITDADIDSVAYHLIRERMRLGLFDNPDHNPYNKISPSVVACKEHQDLALEMARQGIVLLKNDKNLLPFDLSKVKSVAVVGNNADAHEFGDYSGVPANAPVSVLEGIRNICGNKVKVNYAPWVSHPTGLFEPVPKEFVPGGWKAEYYSNADLNGTPKVRTESEIFYDPANQPPDPFRTSAPMSVRWTGTLCPTVSGEYTLALKTDDGCRMWVNGKLLIDAWVSRPAAEDRTTVNFEAGKKYEIKIEYYDGGGDCFARFYWNSPASKRDASIEYFGDAGKVAKESDVVIAVLGVNGWIENEGLDRSKLELPYDQQDFIRALYKVNPRTIVVLLGGSSLSVNWMDKHVPSIIDAWYPGEQGGNAVAETIFGKYNPAGRLPITFYRSLGDLPAFSDYSLNSEQGRTYQYFKGDPLYVFGHGLSYTTFKYSKMAVNNESDKLVVNFTISNVGKRDGDEVAQVYVRYPNMDIPMPIKQLKGFSRVNIKKGKSQKITVEIQKEDLRYWDEKNEKFVTPFGEYEIMVGASSKDIRLKQKVTLN